MEMFNELNKVLFKFIPSLLSSREDCLRRFEVKMAISGLIVFCLFLRVNSSAVLSIIIL